MSGQPWTIGIEEEYMIVDPDTRDLVDDPPPAPMLLLNVIPSHDTSPSLTELP